jgi:hypothetical protein
LKPFTGKGSGTSPLERGWGEVKPRLVRFQMFNPIPMFVFRNFHPADEFNLMKTGAGAAAKITSIK